MGFLESLRLALEGLRANKMRAALTMLGIIIGIAAVIGILTVGDGLSGGYQTTLGARNLASSPERIHVLDSKTLAVPLRYLAKKAVALKEQGQNINQIMEYLQRCIESSVSFVIPEDFEFLKRSGRLTPFTAKLGSTLKLLPVLDYLKTHYAQKIQLSELSSLIHVCDDRLIRLFKEVTGETPVAWLTNLRMEACIKLLATTDDTIAAIAEQTGFGSDTYMTRVFKQKLGTTPGRYRRR